MFRNIGSNISGKLVLVLFIAANAVYMAMIIYSIPMLMQYSNGLPLFDMLPRGYSYEEAFLLLTALGEEGRAVYVSLQLVLDLLYPLLFALCYSALLTWVVGVGKLSHRSWSYFILVPMLVCLFDYAENIGIWFMVSGYPNLSQNLVILSSTFTMIKSLLTVTYFAGLFLAFCIVVYSKLFHRSKKAVS